MYVFNKLKAIPSVQKVFFAMKKKKVPFVNIKHATIFEYKPS